MPGTVLGSGSAVVSKGDMVAVPILSSTSLMEEPSTQDGNGAETQRGLLVLDHCTRKLTLHSLLHLLNNH